MLDSVLGHRQTNQASGALNSVNGTMEMMWKLLSPTTDNPGKFVCLPAVGKLPFRYIKGAMIHVNTCIQLQRRGNGCQLV